MCSSELSKKVGEDHKSQTYARKNRGEDAMKYKGKSE